MSEWKVFVIRLAFAIDGIQRPDVSDVRKRSPFRSLPLNTGESYTPPDKFHLGIQPVDFFWREFTPGQSFSKFPQRTFRSIASVNPVEKLILGEKANNLVNRVSHLTIKGI